MKLAAPLPIWPIRHDICLLWLWCIGIVMVAISKIGFRAAKASRLTSNCCGRFNDCRVHKLARLPDIWPGHAPDKVSVFEERESVCFARRLSQGLEVVIDCWLHLHCRINACRASRIAGLPNLPRFSPCIIQGFGLVLRSCRRARGPKLQLSWSWQDYCRCQRKASGLSKRFVRESALLLAPTKA